MITNKSLIWIIAVWFLVTLINYYFINFFILAFIWIGMSIVLFILTSIQIIKAIKQIESITKLRMTKLLVFLILFILRFYREIPNQLIENADWKIHKNLRFEIVKDVTSGKLNPNVSYNGVICELPFELPIVSNGGNDIWITRSKEDNLLTVKFWIFRNFFDSPSTMFIYSNNPKTLEKLNNKIKEKPEDNWQLEPNWYRVKGM